MHVSMKKIFANHVFPELSVNVVGFFGFCLQKNIYIQIYKKKQTKYWHGALPALVMLHTTHEHGNKTVTISSMSFSQCLLMGGLLNHLKLPSAD